VLLAIAVLAMTGSVLSRVHEIEGERGWTLTIVSLEGSPDSRSADTSRSANRSR
jgi:hypothetical protein